MTLQRHHTPPGAPPPRTLVARACDVCRSWPCRCDREPLIAVYAEGPTVMPCACGRPIVAYEGHQAAIFTAVSAHNRATTHGLWRRRTGI